MELAVEEIRSNWTCEICGQTVVIEGKAENVWLPPSFQENCRLKDHMIGNECIAFRDPEGARAILSGEQGFDD